MEQPRLTLKIAVYTILQKNDKIFFLRRKNTGWSDGLFCLPAGHVDPHEMPLAAAIRETQEEAAVVVESQNLKFVHVSYRKDKYVDFFFRTTSWIGNPKLNEPEKADQSAWLNYNFDQPKIIPSILDALKHIERGDLYSEYIPLD